MPTQYEDSSSLYEAMQEIKHSRDPEWLESWQRDSAKASLPHVFGEFFIHGVPSVVKCPAEIIRHEVRFSVCDFQ